MYFWASLKNWNFCIIAHQLPLVFATWAMLLYSNSSGEKMATRIIRLSFTLRTKRKKVQWNCQFSISINSSVYQNKNSICFLPEKYYATISQAVKIYWRGLVGSQKNMAQNFHESSLFRYFAKWRQMDKDTDVRCLSWFICSAISTLSIIHRLM